MELHHRKFEMLHWFTMLVPLFVKLHMAILRAPGAEWKMTERQAKKEKKKRLWSKGYPLAILQIWLPICGQCMLPGTSWHHGASEGGLSAAIHQTNENTGEKEGLNEGDILLPSSVTHKFCKEKPNLFLDTQIAQKRFSLPCISFPAWRLTWS